MTIIEQTAIAHGAALVCECADGQLRVTHALTGVIAGGDFPVVWACSAREWEDATREGRPPEGIPWPAEDVRLADDD
jgi:hypothetical protein